LIGLGLNADKTKYMIRLD